MLQYTNHPFIDVGIAAIRAMCGNKSVDAITNADLDTVADRLERYYSTKGPLRNFMSSVFMNSAFVQQAFDREDLKYKRKAYADQVLRLYHKEEQTSSNDRCAFCTAPAQFTASRGQVPLLNGQKIGNFSAQGKPGLPICGQCLLAVHAMPMGSLRSGGRLLLVHSNDKGITERFARKAWQTNAELINDQLLDPNANTWPDAASPKTRLFQMLIEIHEEMISEAEDYEDEGQWFSVTAYYFTNFGDKPRIDIWALPSSVVDFVRQVSQPDFPGRQAWQHVAWQGWQNPEKRASKTKQDESPQEPDTATWRNTLYEDLFDLPFNLSAFLPRHGFVPHGDLDLWASQSNGSWALVELLVRKVVVMNQERIAAIRELGDRVAEHIRTKDDKQLYRSLVFGRYFDNICSALRKAGEWAQPADGKALVPFDLFTKVFVEEGDTADIDWRLARDLLLVRIIERLYEQNWFAHHPEVQQQSESEDEES